MADRYDVLIRGARLRSQPSRHSDLAIAGGRIAAIGERLAGQADTEIDALCSMYAQVY